MNFVFDELKLVMKMIKSSKTHKEKHQTRTKKDDARMQCLSSLRRYDKATHLRAPLDSTAIDSITRSPNNYHETGKMENLSRANLCLVHSPLELDDDDLDLLKLDHLY